MTSCSEEAACGFNWTRSAVAVNVAVSVAVAVNIVDAIDVAFNSGWGPILAAARALFIMRSCTRAAQNSLAVLINYDKQRAKAAKNKTLNQVQQQQGRRGKFEDAEKKLFCEIIFMLCVQIWCMKSAAPTLFLRPKKKLMTEVNCTTTTRQMEAASSGQQHRCPILGGTHE